MSRAALQPDSLLRAPVTRRFLLPLLLPLLSLRAPCAVAEPVSYHREVRPLLRANCTGCHKPGKTKGGLDLTTHAGLLQGGEAGPLKPGHASSAELVSQISGDPPAMPKEADPLTAAEVALLTRWIEEGAKDDTPTDPGAAHRLPQPPVYTRPPSIQALAWSPDGATLALALWHEVVLRFEDRPPVRLVGDSPRVESLAFSPDGRQLAVSGGAPAEFGEVQIWDLKTNQLVRSVKATEDCLFGVSWSPDGTRLAVGCADKQVRVFEAATGREVMRCDNHIDWVLATGWNHDGSRLMSASRDKAIKLIDPKTGFLVDDIARPVAPLLCLARHPREDLVAFGDDTGQVRMHRIAPRGGRLTEQQNSLEENVVRGFLGFGGPVHALAFSPEGTLLAATGARGETRVWKVDLAPPPPQNVGTALAQIPHTQALYALAFTPDGKTLATAGADGRVRVYDMDDPKQKGKLLEDFLPLPPPGAPAATGGR